MSAAEGACCRLAGTSGVLGVALSGAGPGVLLVVDADADTARIADRIRAAAGVPELEIIATSIAGGATQSLIHDAEAVYQESVIQNYVMWFTNPLENASGARQVTLVIYKFSLH